MLSIDRIYYGGEAGQFRARDDTFGWKSAAGPRDALRSAASVLKAEWFEGTLKILCRTEDTGGTEVLTLDGFASKDYDGLFRYFRESCNDVYIKKHKPVVSIDEDDFDCAMRYVEDAADIVDECQSGSVAKKAREADLMEKVGGLRNGLERAVGGDKQALSRVFSANGCERIGRLRLVIRTVQLEVYSGDPRWAHLRDTAKTIKSVLHELGTFRRWVPPTDGGHESQARRQMVWELKAKQRGPDGAGNDDNDDEDDFDDDSGDAPRSRPGGEGVPRVGRIDVAALGHIDVTKLGPAGMAPPAVPATQRSIADGDSSPAGAATDARSAVPGATPPPRGALTAPPRNRSTSDGTPQGMDASGRDLRWCHAGSLCEGWVWKRSRFLRQWRRRWFVLMPQRLDSYRQRGGVATETIHAGSTQQYTLYNADDELMMRNTFCIAGVKRMYYVSCDSPEEKQRWVQEIAQVLAPSRRRS